MVKTHINFLYSHAKIPHVPRWNFIMFIREYMVYIILSKNIFVSNDIFLKIFIYNLNRSER